MENTAADLPDTLLDGASVRVVRRELTKLMKGKWAAYWVPAMNKIDRSWLAWKVETKLDEYWAARSGEPIYSREAIAREIDWYLPKTFWHLKRKKKGAVRSTVVDPDNKTFSQWHFEYEETKNRLRDEYARRLADIEERKSRSRGIVFNRETGEIVEMDEEGGLS